jgi:hypothetical protein
LRFALPDPVQQPNRAQQQLQQHQLPLQHQHQHQQQQVHKAVRPCGGPMINTMTPAPMAGATSAAMAAHQMHLHQQRSASRPCNVTIPPRTVTLNMS